MKAESVPLVFLHALGADGTSWDEIVTRLPDFTVITMDLPGHGKRPLTSSALSLQEISDLVIHQVHLMGFDRVHIVGMSLGGIIAQDLAATHPNFVDHLVLIDTVPTYPEFVRQQWRERAEIARTRGMADLLEPTLATWFTADALAAQTPTITRFTEVFLSTNPEGYAQTCELLAEVDIETHLPKIATPTLIVCGQDDLPPFLNAVPTFTSQIPGSRSSWIDPGRHAAALESPDAFVSTLRDFLSS
jgi:3-oxoadipate enol-lactonase